MLTFLDRYQEHTYALLRMVTGFLFIWHGTQKLFGFPLPAREGVPAFVTWGAGGIELVGGILVMIGLFTRPAAFISSGTMAFAYWLAHGTQALLPINNGGELAALYCFAFLAIAARGAGILSIDNLRR
jgi:putative oxidoreductase